jgi:hypothetical protein
MTIGTISNGESGLSVRTKLNSVIAEVNGLGTAATEDIGDFATAAQGALAATAVQPGDLAAVATSGDYDDLSNKPTLGTAAAAATTDFATAAQGSLADSAVQPGDNANTLGSGAALLGYVLTADGAGDSDWVAATGGGGTPGGSDTQVQFNDGGAFGGDSGLTFNKTAKTLGLSGATITADSPIINAAQTWNNAAVTFTGIKLNVTDTASAAASRLIDLQVGGVSRFNIPKAGNTINFTDASFGAAAIQANGARIDFIPAAAGSVAKGAIDFAGRFCAVATLQIGSTDQANAKVVLARDADDILALRRGVNAQAFNIYNTYTDASNYERGFVKWVSNVLRIGTEKLGTGAARALEFQTDGATRLTIATNGGISTPTTGGTITIQSSFSTNSSFNFVAYNAGQIGWASAGSVGPSTALDTGFVRAGGAVVRVTNGSTGGGAMQMTEMTAPAAPAADNVRIYAEDDGAGKTRLMALFATGAAVQIAIEP